MKNILLVLTFFLSFLITFDLFLKEPPVWPDEPSLIYVINLFNGNLLDAYHIYPSIYTALLFNWFRIFGVSIEAQRMLSMLSGIVTMIIFGFLVHSLSKFFLKKSTFRIAPLILLVTDFAFLQSTRIGRPEIFTLLFGLSSIYLLYLFISKKSNKLIFFAFSFISAVLAFLFHANGLIYLLTSSVTGFIFYRKQSIKNKKLVVLFAICFFALFIFLLLRVMPTLTSIFARLQISGNQESWIITVFRSKPIEFKLIYFSLSLATILFTVFAYLRKKLELFIIAFPLVLSWIILILNKDFWYAVYLVPLAILALYILLESYYSLWQISKSSQNKFKVISLILLCFTIFLSNLKLHIDILRIEGGEKYSYQQYITEIRQLIPDSKSVFTSAIPDPYYAFLDRKNNKLIRFPQSYIERNTFLEMLNDSDFIIYNGSFSYSREDLVLNYFKLNYSKLTQIGGPEQYQGVVVELKPRDQRKNP